jgi:hypothetical protein
MNKRIAKKVLSRASTLYLQKNRVLVARNTYKNNMEWFVRKGFYLIPIPEDNYYSLPTNDEQH